MKMVGGSGIRERWPDRGRRPGYRPSLFRGSGLLPSSDFDAVAYGAQQHPVPDGGVGAQRCCGKNSRTRNHQAGRLDGFEKAYPRQLSGGMQQRVALCRAIIHEPAILLMDEPFGALDELTRLEMNDLLLDIRRVTGATVLFVTHSIAEAIYLSDKVVVFSKRPAVIVKELKVNIPYPRSAQSPIPSKIYRCSNGKQACTRPGAPMSGPSQLVYPLAGAAIIVLAWHYYVVLFNVPVVSCCHCLGGLGRDIRRRKICSRKAGSPR